MTTANRNELRIFFCAEDGCSEPLFYGRTKCHAHSRIWSRNRKTGHAAHGARIQKAKGSYVYWSYYGFPLILEHVVVAEQAAGIPLSHPVEIHHWNEDRSDNRNENLVICQNRAYHHLLHIRSRAYDACGNANWRHCTICKKYDDPVNMKLSYQYTTEAYRHLSCAREQYYAKRKVVNPRVFGSA